MAVNDWYTQGAGYPLGPINNPYNNYGLGNLQQSRQLMDPTMMMGQLGNQPQGITFDPAQGNRGRWSQQNVPNESTGIMETIKGWTTPAMSFLKKIGGQRSPEKQAAYEAIMGSRDKEGWGTYKGDQYNIQDGKIYSEVNPFGKNFDSAFGSKSLEEMEEKTLSKAMARLAAGKSISQRLRNILQSRGRLDVTGTDRAGQDNIPVGPISTGGTTGGGTTGGGYTGPPTRDFDPGLARAMGSYNRTAGPMGGEGYGPWKAEGGRIGYQEGELVEDESMFEATPGGMMEENIEEVQGEPSREQLEAIAFEIFQLPLEELNEEQLEVVYQAAMEQEPSEEEVQFAAQEGPGEGIASLV